MAKTKRKHLAALDAEKRPKLPAQETLMCSLSSCKQESSSNSEQRPLRPPTAQHPPNLDGKSDPTAEASSSFEEGGPEAVANMNPPSLQQDDDAHSDCNSWVEVRKQRVVIIIPPLPEAKSKPPRIMLARVRKDNAQTRKTNAQDRSRAKSPSSKANGKKAWDALETESKGNGNNMRETTSRYPPPISGMDILLASALGTEHTPWQGPQHQRIDLLASCTQEEASLDTADSSIQPFSNRAKPVMRNKGALNLDCKPAHSNKSKKLMKPQKTTRLKNDLNKNKSEGIKNSSVSSVSQSIRIVTLKKHLEKAGGLKGWLCSLGLSQFKEAFGKRRWSEGDLLQLQMDDLKHMGKTAVGPRRKLIWAIHHLSQRMI